MMKRTEAVALAARLVDWLRETRRAETDELCPGVVARTARLGDFLVVHESGPHGHGLLIVATLPDGGIVFASESVPSADLDAFAARPEALAAIGRDLDGVAASVSVH